MKLKQISRWGFHALVVAFLGGGVLAIVVGLSTISSCPRMREQPRIKPYEAVDFFDDERSVRHPPEGTIARGQRKMDAAFYYGLETLPSFEQEQDPVGLAAKMDARGWPGPRPHRGPPAGRDDDQRFVDSIPIPLTQEVLEQGQEQFGIYCTPCHGLAGYGDGVVTHRGFPSPPSYHTERLRQVPPGYLFNVITNGYGLMYSYKSRLTPAERWATVAYIRALQLSQHAPKELLSPQDIEQLEEAPQ